MSDDVMWPENYVHLISWLLLLHCYLVIWYSVEVFCYLWLCLVYSDSMCVTPFHNIGATVSTHLYSCFETNHKLRPLRPWLCVYLCLLFIHHSVITYSRTSVFVCLTSWRPLFYSLFKAGILHHYSALMFCIKGTNMEWGTIVVLAKNGSIAGSLVR